MAHLQQNKDVDYEPSVEDEAAWYDRVRLEEAFANGGTIMDDTKSAPGSLILGGVASSSGRGPQITDDAFTRLAAESSFKRMRVERPRQAWEEHPVFKKKSSRTSLTSWLAGTPSVGIRETLNCPQEPEQFGGEDASKIPWTIERRLKNVRLQKCDEDERNYALKKLKAMVLLDPAASGLGLSLVDKTGALEADEVVSASFCDAFSSKAAGTLTKRAASLQRLVLQLYNQGVESPWRMAEADLYNALTALRDNGCGATAPAHILESLRFLHGIIRFQCIDLEAVISARCKGLAHSSFLGKAPLKQRDPLSCSQVKALENLMVRAGAVEQCILGQVLFCVHAVCRWKDAQRIKSLELLGSGESQVLFGDALGSKTALSKEAKTKFTPYAALAQGLTECNWGRLWMDARAKCGLSFGAGPEGYALPTRSLRLDAWGSTPMGAAEASAWIQEWLADESPGAKSLGTHSLKVTLLTWAGRSTIVKLSKAERLLLGHHVQPSVKSMLTYSREAYTSLAGKVLALYRTIRSGAFDPDLDPASRVRQVADSLIDEEIAARVELQPEEVVAEQIDASDEDSAESEADGEDPAPFVLPNLPVLRAPFANVDVSKCRIHFVSGIAHCLRDEDTFWCGRACTERYTRYSGVGTEDPDVCLQCSRAMNE